MNINDLDDTWGEKMHSHDRTLLAKLGFSDPDKKNPDHDLACLYLSQPEVRRKVGDWLAGQINFGSDITVVKVRGRADLEYHLQKGTGQYATTIGFIDVMYSFTIDAEKTIREEFDQLHQRWRPCEPRQGIVKDYRQFCVFVEVKIEPVSIGDVLRQMNLYAAYTKPGIDFPKGLLVAPWDISEPEVESLKNAGFLHMKLGSAFKEWVASNTAKAKPFEI